MIYLDAAATTLHKPPAVRRAVQDALRRAAGYARGGHPAAVYAGEIVYDCREQLAALYHFSAPEQVVMTANATHALNLALHALVRPGMRVAVSGLEHNAVMRPLHLLGVAPQVLEGGLWQPEIMTESAFRAIRDGVELLVMTHVSNVFGMQLPVEEIASETDRAGIPLVIDDAQGAGVLPIDMGRHPSIAAVCLPGHKGLYGPMGTGALLAADVRIARHPLLAGGTGSLSEQIAMPDFLPDAQESGTPNVPGIAGLAAGIRFVRARGTDEILRRERALAAHFAQTVGNLPEIECFTGAGQTGVISLRVRGTPCETVAERLARRGVAVRAGLHCAPLAHRTAGTEEGGTVRFSFSAFSSERDARRAAAALHAVVKNL